MIPALLMMVVNWWEAKGQAYLHCCDVSPCLVKHVEALKDERNKEKYHRG